MKFLINYFLFFMLPGLVVFGLIPILLKPYILKIYKFLNKNKISNKTFSISCAVLFIIFYFFGFLFNSIGLMLVQFLLIISFILLIFVIYVEDQYKKIPKKKINKVFINPNDDKYKNLDSKAKSTAMAKDLIKELKNKNTK